MIASIPTADPPKLGPRIVRLFRPHRGVLALIVAMILLTSVLSVIGALLVRRVFDHALFVPGGPDLGALYPLVAALIAIPIAPIGRARLELFLVIATAARLYFGSSGR